MKINLASIFPALAVLLCMFAGVATAQTVITPDQAHRMALEGEVTIIDVRRPDEWRDTGLPAGAERATVHFTRGPTAFLRRIAKLTKGDKNKPIALICAAGVRSKYASNLLQKRGYTQVLDISEGMLGNNKGAGWLGRALPTEACSDCE